MILTTKQILMLLFIIAPFLLAQGTWIFFDARKRGERHYLLWGLFGLMNIPQSLIVYLIVTRVIFKKNKN